MAEITQKSSVALFPLWSLKKFLGKGDAKKQHGHTKDSKVELDKKLY